MNLDLFADEPAPVQKVVIATWSQEDNRATGGLTMFDKPVTVCNGQELVIVQAADVVDEYPLEPAGLNRWLYKGELIAYDSSKVATPGKGRWSSIEGIGKPEIRGDSHRDICKAIDARSTP